MIFPSSSVRGCGLKFFEHLQPQFQLASSSVRGCGLKLKYTWQHKQLTQVILRARMWIEMSDALTVYSDGHVILRARMWIEMS